MFNDYNAEAVPGPLAPHWIYTEIPRPVHRLVLNGMAQDFSWSRQVPRYVEAYERLLRGPEA